MRFNRPSHVILAGLAFFLSACEPGSKPKVSNSVKTNQATVPAGTLCDEVNHVFDQALSLHLVWTEKDDAELYKKTMRGMVRNYAIYLHADKNQKVKAALDRFAADRIEKISHETATELKQARKQCRDIADFTQAILPFDELRGVENKVFFIPNIYRTFLEEFARELDVFSAYKYPQISNGASVRTHNFGVRLNLKDLEFMPSIPSEIEVFSTLSPEIPLKAGDKITKIFAQDEKEWITIKHIFEKAEGLSTLNEIFLSSTRDELKLQILRSDEMMEVVVKPHVGCEDPPLARARAIGRVIYAELLNFEEPVAEQLRTELLRVREELKANGDELEGIILDFRFNGGGYDSESAAVASLFVKNGIIRKQVSRNRIDSRFSSSIKLPESHGFFNEPLIMIVNRYSISNGEITPKLIRDAKRGLVVGETTFGKSVNQYTFNFDVGSTIGGSFKITQLMSFGRSGESIQGIGLVPDIHITDDQFLARVEGCKNEKNCFPMSIKELSVQKNSPVATHPNIEAFDDQSGEDHLKRWIQKGLAEADAKLGIAAENLSAGKRLEDEGLENDFTLRAAYELVQLRP